MDFRILEDVFSIANHVIIFHLMDSDSKGPNPWTFWRNVSCNSWNIRGYDGDIAINIDLNLNHHSWSHIANDDNGSQLRLAGCIDCRVSRDCCAQQQSQLKLHAITVQIAGEWQWRATLFPYIPTWVYGVHTRFIFEYQDVWWFLLTLHMQHIWCWKARFLGPYAHVLCLNI